MSAAGAGYITLAIYIEYVIYYHFQMNADEYFSALSNPIRLRCVLLLQQRGELCVCELTHALGVAQPLVSRHLAALRESGIVSDRRQGQWIHYRIHPALPRWALNVIRNTARGVADAQPFRGDRDRLQRMPRRPGARLCA